MCSNSQTLTLYSKALCQQSTYNTNLCVFACLCGKCFLDLKYSLAALFINENHFRQCSKMLWTHMIWNKWKEGYCWQFWQTTCWETDNAAWHDLHEKEPFMCYLNDANTAWSSRERSTFFLDMNSLAIQLNVRWVDWYNFRIFPLQKAVADICSAWFCTSWEKLILTFLKVKKARNLYLLYQLLTVDVNKMILCVRVERLCDRDLWSW